MHSPAQTAQLLAQVSGAQYREFSVVRMPLSSRFSASNPPFGAER
jgi:hypothetical protein